MQIKIIEAEHRLAQKKLRVCAYVRVSTNSLEQEGSLENQIEFFKNYIDANDEWEFVEVYYDQGISGFYENRENFQRMMRDARAGKFDLVVVKSVSRFARNTETTLSATRELKRLGIGVFFYLQNLNTLTASGELMLTIRGAFAQAESEVASDNQRMAARRRNENGIPCMAMKRTYGFEPGEGDDILINEQEAAVVRMMFDMASKGVWQSKIKYYLNDHHIPSPAGTKWDDTAVSRVLHNVMYKGDLVFQKFYVDSRRRKRKNRGERDSWYVTGNHPAIVSVEQWEQVQKILAERFRALNEPPPPKREKPRPSRVTYPLTGMLHCPICGEILLHKWGNKRLEYWACKTNLKVSSAACKGIWIPAYIVDGWKIEEPVVIEQYKDEFGMTKYTAFPLEEYEFDKE